MPLLWLSLAFVLGILLGEILDWPFNAWLILAVVCLALFLLQLFLKRKLILPTPRILAGMPLPVLILLAALCMGGARMQLAQPSFTPTDLAFYNDLGERTLVEGVIAEPPELDDARIRIRLKAENLRQAQSEEEEPAISVPVEGQLVARVQDAVALGWRYGDRLRLEGWLETPPEFEDFSYKDYLAHQGIYSQFSVSNSWKVAEDQGNRLKGWIWDLRAHAFEMIYKLFPDPEAALLAGILLGVEGGIPDELVEAFRETGTAHIIAISGFNMAIVAGLFILMFKGLLGPRWGALAAVDGRWDLHDPGGRQRRGGQSRHHGLSGLVRSPGWPAPGRREQPGDRSGLDGVGHAVCSMGRKFPAFFPCYAGVDPLRDANGGKLRRFCQPLPA